jgi:hypothetical protein
MFRYKKIIWLILLFTLLTGGCVRIGWWYFSPNPSDFPLPKNLFPETAQVGDIYNTRDGDPSKQTSDQSVFFNEEKDGEIDKAFHVVEEYHYLHQAKNSFDRDIEWWTERHDYITISSEIKWADRYYLACGYDISESWHCVFEAQYQHFLFRFSSNIGEFFTFVEFLDVVYYIDEMAGEKIVQ